ncbi:MAG TPA: UDP-2,3-diacylglucosamine diphosphatase [Williamwhitmania sp.]|nr:UDP-2,3-diacylglucosamine diphosphatase [Williamwhitmania sp.]
MDKTKLYFISDAHLGLATKQPSVVRERYLVDLLDRAKADAREIFLLGDIFDFWFEYKRVVPKGFTRLLGKIAELTDSGIPVHFFTGNHDIWAFDYLPAEIGVQIHRGPLVVERFGKRFYLAHGDGLGPGDKGYKLLKWVFTRKILQWLFARLHPNLAMWFGQRWSYNSRYAKAIFNDFQGENEDLYIYSNQILEHEHFDFFVYGHRHALAFMPLKDSSATLVVLGDWIVNFTYGVFDGEKFEMKKYRLNESI